MAFGAIATVLLKAESTYVNFICKRLNITLAVAELSYKVWSSHRTSKIRLARPPIQADISCIRRLRSPGSRLQTGRKVLCHWTALATNMMCLHGRHLCRRIGLRSRQRHLVRHTRKYADNNNESCVYMRILTSALHLWPAVFWRVQSGTNILEGLTLLDLCRSRCMSPYKRYCSHNGIGDRVSTLRRIRQSKL